MVAFNLSLTMAVKILVHKPVSQSCAAKSDKFWQATGQSNLPDKMEDCSIGHWTIKLARQNGRLLHWPKSSCLSTKTKLWKLLLWQAFMPIWLSSGLPEFLTFIMIVKLAYTRIGDKNFLFYNISWLTKLMFVLNSLEVSFLWERFEDLIAFWWTCMNICNW